MMYAKADKEEQVGFLLCQLRKRLYNNKRRHQAFGKNEGVKKMTDQIVEVLNRLVAHYGFQYWWESDDWLSDWLTMILIQRTNEGNAERALKNLQPYLTIEQLEQLTLEQLEELIRPAGFYRQKSQAIKALLDWFKGHGGEVSALEHFSTKELREELLSIKGVGPETADVMLLYIFKRKAFIADTYAQRLFKRLGLGDYLSYEEMRNALLPIPEEISWELCREWHAVIDIHGKHYRKQPNMDESWLIK
ncbi:hypothetical protein IGI49_004072 [Enterococcus sp. AZ071]